VSILISIEDAWARMLALAKPVDAEDVALDDALGHYLASDLVAKRTQPSGDMSAMDGYAVRSGDGDNSWKVVGECRAGSPPCPALARGEAARIFTGALLPGAADSVIIQENCTPTGDLVAQTSGEPPTPGGNVRKAGSDFAEGDVLLQKGHHVHAGTVGLGAIAGYDRLSVHRKLKVSLISTGDELVAPGMPVLPHQIASSNGVMLSALLARLPVAARRVGPVRDDFDAVCAAIEAASSGDILVTIGGASVGDHDLVLPALKHLGADMEFWKVAIKPGKPLMIGRLNRAIVVGLPGNPASAYVTAIIFLLPLIRALSGAAEVLPRFDHAKLTSALPACGNRTEFLRAVADGDSVKTFPSQDSAKLSVLAKANALIRREMGSPALDAGSLVPMLRLD
jgi:molybdopterin molybdotransferase